MLHFSDAKFALLLLAAAAAFCVVTCDDCSTKCNKFDKKFKIIPANLTCSKPTPFCCYVRGRMPNVSCCDNCRMSLDLYECDNISYWKYVGYSIGGLVLLFLLAGLIFGLVKLVKSLCCKHRSTVASSAAVANSSADYPRNIESVPEWQQPPKKPPEYYDIFTVSPPPTYKERPDSA